MKIVRAKVLGFCMGVRRAVEISLEEAKRASSKPGSKVYTLGSLIHNPKVLEELKSLGINAVNPDDFNHYVSKFHTSSFIIRAHGINPKTEKDLTEKGCRIIDATCPKVKKNQLKVQELSCAGYNLFLAGEEQHAEIAGLLGYACSSAESAFCVVVGNAEEAISKAKVLVSQNKNGKTAILGQTTISKDEYINIANALKKYFPALEIFDTICSATKDRQDALYELLSQCDAVIIAGGKESANTHRLLSIAQQSGKPCVLAEAASDIPPEFFNFNSVGISAGASTPDSVVEEIEKALRVSS